MDTNAYTVFQQLHLRQSREVDFQVGMGGGRVPHSKPSLASPAMIVGSIAVNSDDVITYGRDVTRFGVFRCTSQHHTAMRNVTRKQLIHTEQNAQFAHAISANRSTAVTRPTHSIQTWIQNKVSGVAWCSQFADALNGHKTGQCDETCVARVQFKQLKSELNLSALRQFSPGAAIAGGVKRTCPPKFRQGDDMLHAPPP